MDLEITKSHAYNATRRQGEGCPTYRALKAAGFKAVWVSEDDIEVDGKVFKIPQTLVKAINDFDDGKPFKTGTYRIPGLKAPMAKSKSK